MLNRAICGILLGCSLLSAGPNDWERIEVEPEGRIDAIADFGDGVIVLGTRLPNPSNVYRSDDLGATGCISATANLNPTDIAAVIDLCHEGRWDEAEALHEKVKKVRLLFQDYAPIPAQKALMARITGDDKWHNLRAPLQAISADKAAELAKVLTTDFGFDFDS